MERFENNDIFNADAYNGLDFEKIKIYDYLLSTNPDIIDYAKSRCSTSLLYFAYFCYKKIWNDHQEIINHIITYKYNSIDDMAICMLAAEQGNLNIIQKLSENGYDFNIYMFHNNSNYLKEKSITNEISACYFESHYISNYILKNGNDNVIFYLIENKIINPELFEASDILNIINKRYLLEYMISTYFFDEYSITKIISVYLRSDISEIDKTLLSKMIDICGDNAIYLILEHSLKIMRKSPEEKLKILIEMGFTKFDKLIYLACVNSNYELIDILLSKGYTLGEECIDLLIDKLNKNIIDLFEKYSIDLSSYKYSNIEDIENFHKLKNLNIDPEQLCLRMMSKFIISNNHYSGSLSALTAKDLRILKNFKWNS
ncbi:hypothetical protein QLL95_gp0567 [Cotonvirus japonicus]|uniref:Ankyrin repeat protein n=1 Tax=Cotonvirus japonicus TaxID=2811091 RepID=A0ABM7NTX3_9VIRU|nr:hypothetical protein QLL95_gp0567 [Cotonvirus japonicus]BCS83556.1 hypothetical protein [Cotonvirus japonicus]